MLKRLTGLYPNSKMKSQSEKFSKMTRWLTQLQSPEVKEPLESSRDSELPNFQERPTEDLERWHVLELGIQLLLNGQSQEPVNSVTITELKLTTRSTELVQEPAEEPRTTLPPRPIHASRISPQSEDSPITVLSTKTSFS